MNYWLITIFLLAAKSCLVESGCSYSNLFKVDFDALCEEWWMKSYHYSSNGSARRKCIQLIQEKCPKKLTLKTTVTKTYDVNRLSFETWHEEVKASSVVNTENWRIYNVYKKYPLCFDDEGKSITCDFWWKVARENRAENKDKEFCINQIKKYCKNDISYQDEVDVCDVQRCLSGYKIKKVTYKDKDGETASFNRYVRGEKK